MTGRRGTAAATAIDAQWMAEACALARLGLGRTAPNPIVGAVVVSRDGRRRLGQGFHARAGTGHAEVVALADAQAAGHKVRGATVYCTLEPCNHHGRTGPCAEALIAAGVARVVYAVPDPIALHAGGGARLRAAGIEVVVGVGAAQAAADNQAWLTTVERRRPWVLGKVAMSLDGKIARPGAATPWITGEAARADGRSWRDRLDAIAVGVGTVLADDPRLTCHGVPPSDRGPARDPVRVIVDARLRTPPTARLLPAHAHGSTARVIIATTSAAAAVRERRLVAGGAEVWRLPAAPDGRVGLPGLMRALARAGMTSLLVEGGPRLLTSCLQADVIDAWRIYVAPRVIGADGTAWTGPVSARGQASRWQLAGPPEAFADDVAWHLTRAAVAPQPGSRVRGRRGK